jgi:hypothetical protein
LTTDLSRKAIVDLAMSWKCRASAGGTDPPSVITALIQLMAAVLAQVLLELATLHAVIR